MFNIPILLAIASLMTNSLSKPLFIHNTNNVPATNILLPEPFIDEGILNIAGNTNQIGNSNVIVLISTNLINWTITTNYTFNWIYTNIRYMSNRITRVITPVLTNYISNSLYIQLPPGTTQSFTRIKYVK